MLPHVSVACDPQQMAYSLLLEIHQSTKQDSSAELRMLDSKSQPAYDLGKPLQPDGFAVLYVRSVTVLANHY